MENRAKAEQYFLEYHYSGYYEKYKRDGIEGYYCRLYKMAVEAIEDIKNVKSTLVWAGVGKQLDIHYRAMDRIINRVTGGKGNGI